MIGIGIDTGGTCTDAVVFDITERCILASAKSQTTHDHLEQGIGNSLDKLPKELLHQASFSCTVYHTGHQCLRGKQRRPGIHDFYRSQ